jgi:hypothetical protein
MKRSGPMMPAYRSLFMPSTVGSDAAAVVSRAIDFGSHPRG